MNPFDIIPDIKYPKIIGAFYLNDMAFEDDPTNIFKMINNKIKSTKIVVEMPDKKEIRLLNSYKNQTLKVGNILVKINSKGQLIFDNN